SYAEAIARGEEQQLTRCVPGGNATSRALKELLAGFAAPAANPPTVAAAVIPAAPAPLPATIDAPFPARLVMAQRLNRGGSEKDTRHIVLAAAPGALAYQVGDSLGVVACNCPELVGAIVARLGAKPDTQVLSPDGVERPLSEALSRFSEIRRPS